MLRLIASLLLLALSACASSGIADRADCPMPSERPMTAAALFFGRDIAGRGPLTDAEWSDFAEQVIAREFPEGFTVIDGEGRWRDPQTQAVVREGTKVVLLAEMPSAEFTQKSARVIAAYRTQFHQTSVGVLTGAACGKF